MGQMNVGFADAAHSGLQHLDLHFGMFQLEKLLANGLDRSAHVGPQDDIQRLLIVDLAQALEEGFQRHVLTAAGEIALAGLRQALVGANRGASRRGVHARRRDCEGAIRHGGKTVTVYQRRH